MGLKWRGEHGVTMDWTTKVATPKPTYDGAVLGITGRSERVMSDVWEYMSYARVWTGTAIAEVHVGTSDFGIYADVTVDATPAVLAAARAWDVAEAGKRWLADRHAAWDRLVAEAHTVAVGKDVVVVAGRKVPKGTTGRVFWVGEGAYYGPVPRYRHGWSTRGALRVGFTDAAGTTFWTAASNLDVTNPDDYLTVPTPYPPTAADILAAGERAVAATERKAA